MNIQTATICMSHLSRRRGLERIKLLEAAGLIERWHEAQSIRCLIKINVIESLSNYLLQECCGGSNQTC